MEWRGGGGGGGGRVQGGCTLFPKFKNGNFISAKPSLYCIFIHKLLGGREAVCKKSTFCMHMKMMEKIDDP